MLPSCCRGDAFGKSCCASLVWLRDALAAVSTHHRQRGRADGGPHARDTELAHDEAAYEAETAPLARLLSVYFVGQFYNTKAGGVAETCSGVVTRGSFPLVVPFRSES